MTGSFKKNYWYRFNGKARNVLIHYDETIGITRHGKFMLDGKWHQCKEEGYFYCTASFYDSPDPYKYCGFGDMTKSKEERLYMFDEMSPAMYNIKKLKEN